MSPFRRRPCMTLPGATYVHEGPVTMKGIRELEPGHVVDRYICKRCGDELFALNRDVEALRSGTPPDVLLARIRASDSMSLIQEAHQ